MKRRDLLKSAAGLAVAPLVPALPAAAAPVGVEHGLSDFTIGEVRLVVGEGRYKWSPLLAKCDWERAKQAK